MKDNTAQAYLRWLTREEGGRREVPLNLHHVIVSRFKDSASTWPQEAWSLVIDFTEPPRSDRTVLANIKFLSSEGPVELFYPGSQFELLDGYRVIAQGEVIA